jgi:predicted dehydrogenase
MGLDHPHIFGMAHAVVSAGAELAWLHPPDAPLAAAFAKLHPGARPAREPAEILEDPAVSLVLCAGVPCERAPLGIEVMRHGKDFLVDKPGFTTLGQLEEARRVQRETGRIYSVCFSERFESRAAERASQLVAQGAIGRVIHTVGLGPHRANLGQRPAWFFERERYGGILTDIASHQVDQFLHFTGSRAARVVYSAVANRAHPEHPELEDFGEALLEGEGASGYVRVDWFTPPGLPVWGDGRLFLLGTEGSLELRKYLDPAGRPGGDHLFLADGRETCHIDCRDVPLPFGARLLDDVRARTETAMSQAHCFLASELALSAQAQARRLEPWGGHA